MLLCGRPGCLSSPTESRLSPADGGSKCRTVSAGESNPEEIEAQENRTNTGFSTFGRIGGRPLVLRREVARLIRRRIRRRDFATSQSSKGIREREARRAALGGQTGRKRGEPSEGLRRGKRRKPRHFRP